MAKKKVLKKKKTKQLKTGLAQKYDCTQNCCKILFIFMAFMKEETNFNVLMQNKKKKT